MAQSGPIANFSFEMRTQDTGHFLAYGRANMDNIEAAIGPHTQRVFEVHVARSGVCM